MIYWDTSCVLKLYTPEDDSGVYLGMADRSSEPLFSSEVLDTELFYALCQKENRGEIKPGWAERIHQKLVSTRRLNSARRLSPGFNTTMPLPGSPRE